MAVMMFCTGKAMETAVKAFSLIMATKMESTTLYSAWIKNEIIMGTLITASSRPMGMVPSLLFCSMVFLPLSGPRIIADFCRNEKENRLFPRVLPDFPLFRKSSQEISE